MRRFKIITVVYDEFMRQGSVLPINHFITTIPLSKGSTAASTYHKSHVMKEARG